ncbi:hypothetical protein [Vibrio aquimaris]|uniref:Uncharacterized protein n=1 Tax=Vibrio aquimaris TaxID=2587862 RepID=A0A5P9CH71_9VIBR|nr:hypothetical protein [Vibrio aquimaris]QFT25678.1 hypothetical protein FIV01_04480 [Vibrio aquimaris]
MNTFVNIGHSTPSTLAGRSHVIENQTDKIEVKSVTANCDGGKTSLEGIPSLTKVSKGKDNFKCKVASSEEAHNLELRSNAAATKRSDNTYKFRRNNTTFIDSPIPGKLYSLDDLLTEGIYMPKVSNWNEIPCCKKSDAYEALLFRNRVLSKKINDRQDIYRIIRGHVNPEFTPFYDEATNRVLLVKFDSKLQGLGITAGTIYDWKGGKLGNIILRKDCLWSTQSNQELSHNIISKDDAASFLNFGREPSGDKGEVEAKTAKWIESIAQKNTLFSQGDLAFKIYPSERNYTEIALKSKLSHMVDSRNLYFDKYGNFDEKSWKKFIKNNGISILGTKKEPVRRMLKDLYFNSQSFRRMFNQNINQHQKLEIIFPASDTYHSPNIHENAPKSRQVYLQETPAVNELGMHNSLAHELTHAFARLDDYPRYYRFLLTPQERESFKVAFPGPVELINHKIAEELASNGIGIAYKLHPYGSASRVYKRFS